MGYYLNYNSKGNPLPARQKANALIEDGAKITSAAFQDNLVCVVDNGLFDAACYCYSQREFDEFNSPSDHRQKTWLIHPSAKELSGYQQ